MDYFQCTVAVASYTSSSGATVRIEQAFWWLYAGRDDWKSTAKLSLGSNVPNLGMFSMSPDALTFAFSQDGEVSYPKPGSDEGAAYNEACLPVVPVTFTFDLHICPTANTFLEIELDADESVLGVFSFDRKKWYSLGRKQKLNWPT